MNKYEVLNLIGEGEFYIGAYGIVIKARNKDTDEIVAIKIFKESDEDENVRKTIIREVRILKMLKNENIVKLKEAFRRKGKLYLVFEYVDKNLLEVIEENPNGLSPEKIKSFIYQLCVAINYCHSLKIIHRDIKPENLLISLNGDLKLCDFGFARQAALNDILTDYVATRWYRAPELLVGYSYDVSVDMWAIGCMMAELIDSQPLFPGENDIDQIYCIQKFLGPLVPQHFEAFSQNKHFSGLRLPKIQYFDSIEKRYQGKIDELAVQFILSLIQMDPAKRMTASQALQHPYFQTSVSEKRPYTSLGYERGRNNYSVNKQKLIPTNGFSPSIVITKKNSQKYYKSVPSDKRKNYEKEFKKKKTTSSSKSGKQQNHLVFRTTSNELKKDIGHTYENKPKFQVNNIETKFKSNNTENYISPDKNQIKFSKRNFTNFNDFSSRIIMNG